MHVVDSVLATSSNVHALRCFLPPLPHLCPQRSPSGIQARQPMCRGLLPRPVGFWGPTAWPAPSLHAGMRDFQNRAFHRRGQTQCPRHWRAAACLLLATSSTSTARTSTSKNTGRLAFSQGARKQPPSNPALPVLQLPAMRQAPAC